MARLQAFYREKVVPGLVEKFGYFNNLRMQQPGQLSQQQIFQMQQQMQM